VWNRGYSLQWEESEFERGTKGTPKKRLSSLRATTSVAGGMEEGGESRGQPHPLASGQIAEKARKKKKSRFPPRRRCHFPTKIHKGGWGTSGLNGPRGTSTKGGEREDGRGGGKLFQKCAKGTKTSKKGKNLEKRGEKAHVLTRSRLTGPRPETKTGTFLGGGGPKKSKRRQRGFPQTPPPHTTATKKRTENGGGGQGGRRSPLTRARKQDAQLKQKLPGKGVGKKDGEFFKKKNPQAVGAEGPPPLKG